MKKIFAFLASLLIAATLMGQAPASFKYQAVLRDARGNIKANTATNIIIDILQGSATGTAVYSETHSVSTDGYGLINLELGKGTATVGAVSSINWGTGTYFVRVTVDGAVMGTGQLLSVPYALYAAKAANGFSGSYNDLTNKPILFDGTFASISNKPTTVAGYGITNSFDGKWTSITDKPTFATVATSGNYNDLTNTPTTDGSETNVHAGTNITVTGAGTASNPYIVNSTASGTAPAGTITGDLQFWDGTNWVLLHRGISGQILTLNSSNIPSWQNTSATSFSAPTVTTQAATTVQSLSATLNGTVNANNLSTTVIFEWGLTTAYGNTATASQSPLTGASDVPVSINIASLQAATTYHYRIKATNAVNVTSGNDLTFITALPGPQLTTSDVSSITKISASGGGNITFDGGTTITARGVCWSITANPTIANSKTIDGSGTGAFTSSIAGLTAGTLYYVRAYATNIVGTTYGNQVSFTTYNGDAITDNDNNYYNTVTIGTQVWMAENLKTTTYNNGDPIGTTTSDISGESTPKYQWAYEGNESNITAYGRLYTWYAATDSRNVCPTGWHVSSDAEWTTLTTFLGGEYIAGSKLKETGTTHWLSPNGDATNESGFTALPGGWRTNTGSFDYFGNYGFWWNSSESNASYAWSRYLGNYGSSVARYNASKQYGLSVRCLQGTVPATTLPVVSTQNVTDITPTTATSGGSIISDGDATISESGVYWGTSSNPETTGTKLPIGSGSGSFSTSLSGLDPGTIYYVKAYATNSAGTAYGFEVSFTTYNADAIADNENNYYNVVNIGGMNWMAENLRATTYSNGDPIATTSSDISGESTPRYQWAYDGYESNAASYGRLYTWYAATDERNVCPTYWHISTDDEWTTLTEYLRIFGYGYEGSGSDIAKSMAATWGWNSGDSEPGDIGYDMFDNNSSAFTALPGGYHGSSGVYYYMGYSGYWWSATGGGAAGAYSRVMDNSGSGVGRYGNGERDGFSVRCVEDAF